MLGDFTGVTFDRIYFWSYVEREDKVPGDPEGLCSLRYFFLSLVDLGPFYYYFILMLIRSDLGRQRHINEVQSSGQVSVHMNITSVPSMLG